MHIRDILAGEETVFSFEFFPPKSTAGEDSLFRTVSELKPYGPAFVSITYGAGGTTRNSTHGLVLRMLRDTGIHTVPHLTCIGHNKREISQLLENYAQAGVSNILALRGDPPRNGSPFPSGDFAHAAELVAHIRHFSDRHRYNFGVGVAGFPEGHPETPNRIREMEFLKAKVDAGADYICTQLFFDNTDFFDFRDRCDLSGIHVPILAGIMPVTSMNGLKRMAELAGGTRFPAKLIRALDRANKDPDSIRNVGIHYATTQCAELLDQKAKGIHFYTLNQSSATVEIFHSLGIHAPIINHEPNHRKSPTPPAGHM